jgi:hypothetical protein
VSDQSGAGEYEHPTAPPVPFQPLRDRKTSTK